LRYIKLAQTLMIFTDVLIASQGLFDFTICGRHVNNTVMLHLVDQIMVKMVNLIAGFAVDIYLLFFADYSISTSWGELLTALLRSFRS